MAREAIIGSSGSGAMAAGSDTADQRLPCQLHSFIAVVSGKKLAEVAVELGVSQQRVHQRVERARMPLAQASVHSRRDDPVPRWMPVS